MDAMERQWRTRTRGYAPSVFDALDERPFSGEELARDGTALLLVVRSASKGRHPSLIDFSVAALHVYATQTQQQFAPLAAALVPRPLPASVATARLAAELAHIRSEARPESVTVTQALTLFDAGGKIGIAGETSEGYIALFAEI